METVLQWLKLNPTKSEMQELYKKYDQSNRGIISRDSVLHIMNKKQTDTDTIDELVEALKLFDTDKTGKIPVPEFRWAMTKLGDTFEETQVDDMLKELEDEGNVDVMRMARACFGIKEEKPKDGDKKDAKKGDGKKDAKKKK